MSTPPTKTPTCKVCHQRKVRCDGMTPCGSCSRSRKALVCEYLESSNRAGSELPKGAACLQCRKRKRKCDGGRPCLACKDTSHADACQHRAHGSSREQERIPRDQGTFSLDSRGPPSSTTIPTTVEPSSATLAGTLPQVNPPLASITNAATIRDAAGLSTPPVAVSLDTELYSVRTLFLNKSWYFGLKITAEKRTAIASGDSSGSVVHPIFIPLCTLLGYLLASQEDGKRDVYREREAVQRARVLALLDTLAGSETPDPLTLVQVYILLASYYAQRENIRGYHEYLGNASNVALRHHAALGLDDSNSESAPPIWSGLSKEPREEGRYALAQLVYLEAAAQISMKLPVNLPPMILAKFRQLPPAKVEEFEVNFLRARCVLLLQESQQLAAEWTTWEQGMVGSEWGERWIKLTASIQLQLRLLTTALKDSPTLEIPPLVLTSCTIVVFAALAELYAVFAPFHPCARQKHANIIESIANTSRTLSLEDHHSFDCTLETCWEIASREIPEPTEPTPQWQLCFANVVLLGDTSDPDPSDSLSD
ncbi:hypothetical protein B0H12DRAFT_1113067 [Mycena haematopus]|nr:hypothetical protein B0H12DRAFT_1113067 [Mycena haematopus]